MNSCIVRLIHSGFFVFFFPPIKDDDTDINSWKRIGLVYFAYQLTAVYDKPQLEVYL